MEEYSDRPPADVAWYPMVPIRDVVIFPFTKVAFKIGRAGSVRALEQALATDRTIFLATQHDATVDEPGPEQNLRSGNSRTHSPVTKTGEWSDQSRRRRT